MRAFLLACLAIVVIGAGGYLGLNTLQQPSGSLLDTPSPVNRQQAEGEICPADVGPSAFAGLRRVLHAALIARPPFGTRMPAGSADWRRCGSACGSVIPITMAIRQRLSIAPEVHHLRPLMT